MAAPREAARGRDPAITQPACGRPGLLHPKVETWQMGRTRAGKRLGANAQRLRRRGRGRRGAGRAGSLRGGTGRSELRPRGVVVKLPHVWREGGKPANKEERSDADLGKNDWTFLALAEPRSSPWIMSLGGEEL